MESSSRIAGGADRGRSGAGALKWKIIGAKRRRAKLPLRKEMWNYVEKGDWGRGTLARSAAGNASCEECNFVLHAFYRVDKCKMK